MDGLTLKNVECLGKEESYNVEKTNISDMKITVNNIEYDRKENVLHRQDNECGYSVTLHFQENSTNIINEIQNILKNEFVSKNYNIYNKNSNNSI